MNNYYVTVAQTARMYVKRLAVITVQKYNDIMT